MNRCIIQTKPWEGICIWCFLPSILTRVCQSCHLYFYPLFIYGIHFRLCVHMYIAVYNLYVTERNIRIWVTNYVAEIVGYFLHLWSFWVRVESQNFVCWFSRKLTSITGYALWISSRNKKSMHRVRIPVVFVILEIPIWKVRIHHFSQKIWSE